MPLRKFDIKPMKSSHTLNGVCLTDNRGDHFFAIITYRYIATEAVTVTDISASFSSRVSISDKRLLEGCKAVTRGYLHVDTWEADTVKREP